MHREQHSECGCGGRGDYGPPRMRAHHGEHGHGGHGHGWGPGGHGHGPFGHAGRARRGFVGFGILSLLAEEPKHGYQIIQELGERSGGMWQPSPGSVYPALEKLEAEGLINAVGEGEGEGDKKTYAITDAGRAKLEKMQEKMPPFMRGGFPAGVSELRSAMGELGAAVMQVGKTGTEDQRARATAELVAVRKRIYAILAED